MTASFDHVIASAEQLGLSDPADPRWTELRPQLLPTSTECAAFLEWARFHRRWQFNVAEAAERICAKPVEAAIVVLSDIVEELRDEQ